MPSVLLVILILLAIQIAVWLIVWQRRHRSRLAPLLELFDAGSGRLQVPLVGSPRLHGQLGQRQLRLHPFERRRVFHLEIGISSDANIFFTVQPRASSEAGGRIRRLSVTLQQPLLDRDFRYYCNSPERLRATFRRAAARDSLFALLHTQGLRQLSSENGWLEAALRAGPKASGFEVSRLRVLLDRLHRMALALEGKS